LLADMPFGMGRGRTGAAGEVGAVKRGFCLLGFFQMSGTVA
jgi:hypothetical protein